MKQLRVKAQEAARAILYKVQLNKSLTNRFFRKTGRKSHISNKKRGYRFREKLCNPLILLVGHGGIEPPTY
jgi:hypothetical protein